LILKRTSLPCFSVKYKEKWKNWNDGMMEYWNVGFGRLGEWGVGDMGKWGDGWWVVGRDLIERSLVTGE
jgi:hypothetical protein